MKGTHESDTLEDIIQQIMRLTGVGRPVAYQLAQLAIEYAKPNHGKWGKNT